MTNPINRLSVYDYLIVFLVVLFVINTITQSLWPTSIVFVLASVVIASVLDIGLGWLKSTIKQPQKNQPSMALKGGLPNSATVSGLIIGLLIEPSALTLNALTPVLLAPILAVLLKHIIRIKGDHIFNPANLGLFLTLLILGSTGSLSWWGASPSWLVPLFGLFIMYRLKRLNPAASFLIVYIILFLALDVVNGKLSANSFNQFYSGTLFFFGFIMVQEPVTAPRGKRARLIGGVLAAIFTFIFTFYLQQYSMLLGLVVADLFFPFFNWKYNK